MLTDGDDAVTAACSGIACLFIAPESIVGGVFGSIQLLFLVLVYGFILYKSATLIADGSELLACVLDPGLVGGLLLPVMGAVPDCAIVLFSGLGDNAQESLKVGVGTLAGSTIMLLTLPWFACAWSGRVDLLPGGARARGAAPLLGDDKEREAGPAANYNPGKGGAKLTPGLSLAATLARTGVQTSATIRGAAWICAGSAISYLVIQGPAFALLGRSLKDEAHAESMWALAGLVLSAVLFVTYSCYCVMNANAIEKQAARLNEARRHAVGLRLLSMTSLLTIEDELAQPSESAASARVMHDTFREFDLDGNGELDMSEVQHMLKKLGMRVSGAELKKIMADFGGEDKLVQEGEFQALVHKVADIRRRGGAALELARSESERRSVNGAGDEESGKGEGAAEEEEEEEDDDDEDEAQNLTPLQIKLRAAVLLVIGVGVCVVFSDPMVDVLTELGNRWGISPFYVSFLITPVVSNASELLSSLQFAARKTKRSIDMTYAQLLGAATMNNTLGLGVFLMLVYGRSLAWVFSAEVLTILAVEIAVVVLTLTNSNNVLPIWKASIAGLLFPLSLVLVYVLENVFGLD